MIRRMAALILCSVLALASVWILAVGQPKSEVLASYSTPLEGRMNSQRHNAELGLERLDGAVIEPHGVFSFNSALGSWSRDRGYRKAPVSYNGQLISSWGGGVCQTSTTLYNAALVSNMVILERHPHRFAPSYVPPGRDAAVAYSKVDLRFANPYDFPVRIRGETRRGRLFISVIGITAGRQPPTAIRIVPEVRQVIPPQEYVFNVRNRTARVRNTGKAGYEVAVYRIIGDRKELLSTDSYPAMNRIVEYR